MRIARRFHRVPRRNNQSVSAAIKQAGTAVVEALEIRRLLSGTVVTNTNNDGGGSLRAAITQANTDANAGTADTITFAAALAGDTITLTNGDLELSGKPATGTALITINGGNNITVSGNNASTIFTVDSGVNASISGVTITNGNSSASGGGVINSGTLALTDDTLSSNSAGVDGGGISNTSPGSLTLTGDTLAGNSAPAGNGGAIVNSGGAVILTNDTFTNNSSDNGGALFTAGGGTVTLTDDTLSLNSAHYGGGIYNNGSTLSLTGTLVAGNSALDADADIDGAVDASSSNNLIGDGTGLTGISDGTNNNQVGTTATPVSPLLTPLGNYGGPTQTMPLQTGSPAIGAGVAVNGITTDQRGVPRTATPDIGAYQYTTPATVTIAAGDINGLVTYLSPDSTTTLNLTKSVYDFTQVNNNWYGPDALPPIQSKVTINGNGATLQRDSCLPETTAGAVRFFYVSGGIATELPLGTLTLQNLTLTNGLAKGGDGTAGGGGLGAGGAIFNQGNLTLSGVTLTGNTALGGSSGVGSVESNGGGGIGQDAQVGGSNGVGGGFGGSFPDGIYGGAGDSSGGGGFDAPAAGYTGGGFSGLGGFRPQGTGGDGGSNEGGSTNTGGDFGFGGVTGAGGVGAGGADGSDGGFGGGGGGTDVVGGQDPGHPSAGGFGGGGGGPTGTTAAPGPGGFGGGNASPYIGGGGAGMGGAVFTMFGSLTVINSTLTANTAQGGNAEINGNGTGDAGSGYGGAIFNLDGTASITFSTLAANAVTAGTGTVNGSADGGALYNLAYGSNYDTGKAVTAAVTIGDSILAGTVGGTHDLVNQEVDGDYPTGPNADMNTGNTASITAPVSTPGAPNIVVASSNIPGGPNGTATLSTTGFVPGVTNASIGLAPLGSYGGPTQTMALLPGSPAIAAGTTVAGITTDQMGFTRSASKPSIGAYENEGFAIATNGGTPQSTAPGTAFATALGVKVISTNKFLTGHLAGGSITFTAPATGASASFSTNPITLAANGGASTIATANSTSGSYSVTATASGITTPASFSLTNNAVAPTPTVTSSTATLPANATTLVINGSNFDPAAANNTVVFNDGAAGTVTSATATSLTVTFTTDPTTAGSLTAVVTSDSASSGTPVQVASVIPVVTPETTNFGATPPTVVVQGFGFDPTHANNTVVLNDGAAGMVTAADATSLTITITTAPTGSGPLTAVVTTDGQSSGAPVQIGTISAAAPTGSLAGSSAAAATGYILTTVGTSDWAAYGVNGNLGSFDHKASGGSQISNITEVGTGTFGGFNDTNRDLTWSDGTPQTTASNEHGFAYVNGGLNTGFTFTAPADSTSRTLYLYLGGYSSGATLTAHLSNSSAPDYVATYSSSGKYNELVTISYSTASANQELVLTYEKTSNINGTGGSADLMAAWLGGPPPVTPASTRPQVTTNPLSQSVTVGTDVQFTAAATGTPTPTVQWYVSVDGGKTFVGYAGGITDTIDIGPATLADNGNEYEATFTNSAGMATTTIATLTVTPASAPSSGSLSGTSSTAAASYNLTTLGKTDWAHFGTGGSATGFDHKANGGSQISNVTKVGSGTFGGYNDPNRSVSWTDGTPDPKDTGDEGYLWVNNGINAGYSFTAPADTTTRTIYVYLGGYSSGAMLTAHLSDSSATDYMATFSGSGKYNDVVAITYKAGSAGQKLVLTYVKSANMNGTSGSADLMAAWLA